MPSLNANTEALALNLSFLLINKNDNQRKTRRAYRRVFHV